jgi:hypothetical protein
LGLESLDLGGLISVGECQSFIAVLLSSETSSGRAGGGPAARRRKGGDGRLGGWVVHTQFVLGLEGHPRVQSGRRGVSDTGFTCKGLLGHRRKRGLRDEGGVIGGGGGGGVWVGGVGSQEVEVRDIDSGVGAVGGDGVVKEVVNGVLNDPELLTWTPYVDMTLGNSASTAQRARGTVQSCVNSDPSTYCERGILYAFFTSSSVCGGGR